MKTLFDDAARAAIQSRLLRLTPDSTARWGKFTAPKMLAHLIDSFEVAFAERSVDVKQSFLNTALGRWLFVDAPMPVPKNLPTAPEFLVTQPGEFERDKARVLTYLERYGRGENQKFGQSPAFGTLTPQQWAKLNYKHLNHHLTQFGV